MICPLNGRICITEGGCDYPCAKAMSHDWRDLDLKPSSRFERTTDRLVAAALAAIATGVVALLLYLLGVL